ncbi:hypothetical protein CORC01_13357 [Colletotrichum orchidophilum]|uniref:Uncharacterized protein n=1 Tax=Colletotrichum orchidophilum TaxID=1209926 RepID=A0A1G4AQ76_9PEZI|nr:uncharacterized protein CORC01_13357 [Colletotrichum orchidophilum]OHE91328.1 hypothetical protein CORC01_13357 [Colletotrichum orchidophilum]
MTSPPRPSRQWPQPVQTQQQDASTKPQSVESLLFGLVPLRSLQYYHESMILAKTRGAKMVQHARVRKQASNLPIRAPPRTLPREGEKRRTDAGRGESTE